MVIRHLCFNYEWIPTSPLEGRNIRFLSNRKNVPGRGDQRTVYFEV